MAVGRCIGFQFNAIMRRNDCVAFFIVVGLAGRPTCFRCISVKFLDAEAVMRFVQVELPDGYRAMQDGVRWEEATSTFFIFLNCQFVVVWAERTGLPGLADPSVEDGD